MADAQSTKDINIWLIYLKRELKKAKLKENEIKEIIDEILITDDVSLPAIKENTLKVLGQKKIDVNITRLYNDSEVMIAKYYSKIFIDNYMENVERLHFEQPFFYDQQNMFWLWDKKEFKYKIVDETDLMNILERAFQFLGQTVNSKVKTQYMEAFKRIGREKQPQEAPAKWIQFKDKAYSLTSKCIYDITPDYFFTNPIPWDMGETSDTPVMDKLLTEWLGEEHKQTAYEIIAYCCLTDYPIHLIFCFIGSGRNGKSRFQALIAKFLGEENICSTELDILLDSRFESFKLYKKLVCSLGETNFGILSKTSLLKKLCGQDLIGFEYKNKKPFDGYNYAKIIIASNSLPTSEDTSEGFYRRWLILNFNNTFPEGKDILNTIPEQEYRNLAKKVTEILPDLLAKAQFTHQGTIEARKQKFIMASNPFSIFLEKCCQMEANAFMRHSELYMSYIYYLSQNKKREISNQEFNKALLHQGLEVQRTSKQINDEWINGRFVLGVELKPNWKEFVSDMSVVLQFPLGFSHRENQYKNATQPTQLTQKPGFEPSNDEILLPCQYCGLKHCIGYYMSKPICEWCLGSLNSQDEFIK